MTTLCIILSPFGARLTPDQQRHYPVDNDPHGMRPYHREKNGRENLEYAREAMKDSLDRDEAPFASHLLYPQVLVGETNENRSLGLSCEKSWIEAALGASIRQKHMFRLMVGVYIDLGVSPGMSETLNFITHHPAFQSADVEIQFRSLVPDEVPEAPESAESAVNVVSFAGETES